VKVDLEAPGSNMFENIIIADMESDGLLDVITKIHTMGIAWRHNGKWAVKSTTDYEDMKRLLLKEDALIAGHNFCKFDIPAFERILGIKVKATILDTLPLSQALFPFRGKHGLESWGEELGVKKPEIENWTDLSIEEYQHRVEEDCKINAKLWDIIEEKLKFLYGNNTKKAMQYCKYLAFKAECLREQEENPIPIDAQLCQSTLERFEKMKQDKIEELIPAMPKAVSTYKSKPAKMTRKDGSISAMGQKWLDLLEENGLPADHEEPIPVYKTPNPNSSQQIKDWLLSIGWKPEIYKEGVNGKVPQLRNNDKELCKSVMKLAEKEPAILALEGISVLTHRIGVLKGFLKNLSFSNTVVAGATSFTNTLRLQHTSPVVNLPKVITKGDDKDSIKDGKWIRGVMKAPEGMLFCGSDMSSLEDRMKQHYIYPLDPEYVHEMMTEDFDPHLDLAVTAEAITQEQADAHKRGEEDHGKVRHIYKTANYSCQYGVGPTTLSKTISKSKAEAQGVIEAYWKRNWAVEKVAESLEVKERRGEMWMKNPVNGFYYNLRSEKDRFSLLCQGGGTYIFDMWLYYARSKGVKMCLQYHDEKGSFLMDTPEEKEKRTEVLKWAVQQVNKSLKLNREMDVDVQFGKSYADVH
jgi:DNA polymerase I-like protein with 3'-5' exonuclease and polymerase domains